MTTDPREPLTPEERDLARRLARAQTHAEPPTALDAAILAAARAELASSAGTTESVAAADVPGHRRRPRWPAIFGLAAAVTLAIGIAWQLRMPPHPAADAIPTPISAPLPRVPGEAPAAMPEPSAESDSALPPMEAESSPQDGHPADRAGTTAAPLTARQTRSRLATSPSETHDMSSLPDAATEKSATAPERTDTSFEHREYPRAPATPAATFSSPMAAPKTQDAKAEESPPAVTEPASQRTPSRTTRAETRAADAVLSPPQPPPFPYAARMAVTPPVAESATPEPGAAASLESAFSPAQWLQHIRELRDNGNIDDAKASLQHFRDRYPDAAIPSDLRPLLVE